MQIMVLIIKMFVFYSLYVCIHILGTFCRIYNCVCTVALDYHTVEPTLEANDRRRKSSICDVMIGRVKRALMPSLRRRSQVERPQHEPGPSWQFTAEGRGLQPFR
jgi:hypothetical protein